MKSSIKTHRFSKQIPLIAFAAMLLLLSCEKTVHIDIPQKPPKLVLNSLLEKGQLIEVRVGKSKGVLEPDNSSQPQLAQYTVSNARVVVWEDNTIIDTLTYRASDYRYTSPRNKLIREGVNYTIRAFAAGYTDIETNATLPSQSVIEEVKLTRDVRMNSSGTPVSEISIKLNDPGAEKNFYLVQVWRAGYSAGTSYPAYCVSSTDIDLETLADDEDPLESESCRDGDALLMKDVNFNGRVKTLRLYVNSDELYEYTNPTTNSISRPYVKVLRISEEQFKYIKSQHAFSMADENPFAEPVNVFTNVKNGFGIFALSTAAVDTLR